MRVCMIGAGYVGLVSGTCFADFGWDVRCIDSDEEKISSLWRGEIPIYEPGLDELVKSNVEAGRLSFQSDLPSAVSSSDLIFLAVGTPMRRGSGYADLSYVYQAAEEIAPHLRGFTVIATKSTVPVGTNREIERRIRAVHPDADFAVCSNPEFLREGSAILDFTRPDRILVGCDDPRAEQVMRRLYEPLTARGTPLLFASRESAELAKYAANSFLAMKISFINEIADLCEAVGADIDEVATAIGKDSRIGRNFLSPGPGYGGSCFPKDVSALVRTAREARSPLSLIEQVQTVNEERKLAMAHRIEDALGETMRGKRLAILGVTFKPDTDDMREAPSLIIIPILQDRGAEIVAYDPQGARHGKELLPGVAWAESPIDAARDADATIILTEWSEFRTLNLNQLRSRMSGDVLVDLRNILDPDEASAEGFAYFGIGRGEHTHIASRQFGRPRYQQSVATHPSAHT